MRSEMCFASSIDYVVTSTDVLRPIFLMRVQISLDETESIPEVGSSIRIRVGSYTRQIASCSFFISIWLKVFAFLDLSERISTSYMVILEWTAALL